MMKLVENTEAGEKKVVDETTNNTNNDDEHEATQNDAENPEEKQPDVKMKPKMDENSRLKEGTIFLRDGMHGPEQVLWIHKNHRGLG